VAEATNYDGFIPAMLERVLDVPRVVALESTTSTMDDAHALAAAGAPAGTVVLAERQSSGRGRAGRRWASDVEGVWMTIIERPNDPRALDVMSIRVGIRAARALDSVVWSPPVGLKCRKLAGVLIETRWRAERIDWAAIGIGVNIHRPDGVDGAATIGRRVDRITVLSELVPAVRAAAAARGPLTAAELDDFAQRDVGRGRACVEPEHGEVQGINESGELLVSTARGVRAFRDGSLVFAEPIE
jgi:BirA family biotin operon repressor/biotin-[acetyl-CoA-carboxylase] ligase